MASFVRIEVPPGTRDLLARVQLDLGAKALRELLFRFFDRQGARIAGAITKGQLSGQVLKRRTGSLARSIVGRGELVDGLPALRVGVLKGPAERYAAVQEFGTVSKGGELPDIVPREAKALAIPVGPALTPAGVNRFGNPRDQPRGTYQLIPFGRGSRGLNATAGLFRTRDLTREYEASKRQHREFDLGNVAAYYLLLRRVGIRPKRFLRNGFAAELPNLVADLAIQLAKVVALQSRKGAKK